MLIYENAFYLSLSRFIMAGGKVAKTPSLRIIVIYISNFKEDGSGVKSKTEL